MGIGRWRKRSKQEEEKEKTEEIDIAEKEALEKLVKKIVFKTTETCAKAVEGANWGLMTANLGAPEKQLVKFVQDELARMLMRMAKGEMRLEDCQEAERVELARSLLIPPEKLAELSLDDSLAVRFMVATNINCPIDCLERLLLDKEDEVAVGAIGNKRTPEVAILELSKKKSSKQIEAGLKKRLGKSYFL